MRPVHEAPRVFIASSGEHLDLANAVQVNLERDAITRVWTQGAFRLSGYPLDNLLAELDQCDFGVFVLAPADRATIRSKRVSIPRDNVVFELGLFTGRLGRQAVFIVVPRSEPALSLPTDLAGLVVGDYQPPDREGDVFAALGPVCTKIRYEIRARTDEVLKRRPGLVQARLFVDFVEEFKVLLGSARRLSLYFIHSRRWRENHNDQIVEFIERAGTQLEVFLPNLGNSSLIRLLQAHFDDGPQIPGFVADAYRYFGELTDRYPGRVLIRRYDHYPSYSFYRFDDEAVIAFYPNTPARRGVPALRIRNDSPFGRFLENDLAELRLQCPEATETALRDAGGPAKSAKVRRPKALQE